MSYVTNKLSRQLLTLIVIIFAIFFVFLGVLLPRIILPVTERNLYNYLRQPLEFVESDIDENLLETEVGYLYIFDNRIVASENLYDIIQIKDVNTLLEKIQDSYGKFIEKKKTYYYYTIHTDQIVKVAITNDTYIKQTNQEILDAVLPMVLLTFVIISLILILWSSVIVKKIEKLKLKIDNIDNDDFDHHVDFQIDDEINSLALAIEDMRVSLKNQEEYRNQMYQNISHDFKTPLTVIKSYIEAVHDNVEDKDTALAVIEEQADKLEQKVHSLLYLNKLDYLQSTQKVALTEVNIATIISRSLEKFKFQRKDINFIVNIDKNSKFYGTDDLWETILDNLLANFMRYAKSEIKITVKNGKLTLFNDGPNIEKDFLDGIFTPFRKGIKGEFGLGLSIVKKTVNLIGYDIMIKNHKKGVSFMIHKRNS